MKIVRFHEFGGPDVLRVETIPDPVPGPNQVVVEVKASALNHVDVDVREGASRFPVTFPHTLGLEVFGVIEAVGDNVTRWRAGDRVVPHIMDTCGECRYCRTGQENLCLAPRSFSYAMAGGYSEKLLCSASQLVRVPDELDDLTAGALQVAFATSWHMLFDRARLQIGERVLINSVSSGIGSAGVQLAKLAGAYVIGTSSSDAKLDRARELGMDEGINYSTHDIVEEVKRITDGAGVDVVYEHVGGELFQKGLESLAKNGRLVTCGAHAGEVTPFDIIPFFRMQRTVLGSFAYNKSEVEKCFELARRGKIRPIIHRTFPLGEAAEAMRTLERREHFGKILLLP